MYVLDSKTCQRCHKSVTLDGFSKNRLASDGLQKWCTTCRKEHYHAKKHEPGYMEEKRARNKDRWHNKDGRNSHFKRHFGITLDIYNDMLKQQNGVCAICSRESQSKRFKNLSVDHCHETGEVRGLLCHKCNCGIGQFGDSTDLASRAITYLARRNTTQHYEPFTFCG